MPQSPQSAEQGHLSAPRFVSQLGSTSSMLTALHWFPLHISQSFQSSSQSSSKISISREPFYSDLGHFILLVFFLILSPNPFELSSPGPGQRGAAAPAVPVFIQAVPLCSCVFLLLTAPLQSLLSTFLFLPHQHLLLLSSSPGSASSSSSPGDGDVLLCTSLWNGFTLHHLCKDAVAHRTNLICDRHITCTPQSNR